MEQIKNVCESINNDSGPSISEEVSGGIFTIDNEEKEIWNDCLGLSNYSFSSFGKIKNKITGKILLPYKNRSGYLRITLNYDDSKKKLTWYID
jgi:hypothetical protein